MVLAAKIRRLILEDVSDEDTKILVEQGWVFVAETIWDQQIWEKQKDYCLNDRLLVDVNEAV